MLTPATRKRRAPRKRRASRFPVSNLQSGEQISDGRGKRKRRAQAGGLGLGRNTAKKSVQSLTIGGAKMSEPQDAKDHGQEENQQADLNPVESDGSDGVSG